MIELMDMVSIPLRMEMCIRDSGNLIERMVKELNIQKMDLNLRAIMTKTLKVDTENSFGPMEINTKVSGLKIKYRALEFINGQLMTNIEENGSKIK